ncbi:hypothetical protein AYI70_g6597 [Smittium culicis]|uniref:Uncharacterized protein n=1 Tax=Smittium culicis TaxID=133412 RepID=A0A1R1XP95_9FUNG|nr:hypothetical protein AYI70_g6597 [Smittium culicis]
MATLLYQSELFILISEIPHDFISDFDIYLNDLNSIKNDVSAIRYIHHLCTLLLEVKQKYVAEKYSHDQYISFMRPYSISANDLYPWLVPKYLTFFKFVCCFNSNYTPISLKKYLFISNNLNKKAKLEYLVNDAP